MSSSARWLVIAATLLVVVAVASALALGWIRLGWGPEAPPPKPKPTIQPRTFPVYLAQPKGDS